MHKKLKLPQLNQQQWLWLYLLAALLIASKVMYNQHGWVNTDSLLYFEQARLLSEGKWGEAYQMFSWILYPSLIALIHYLSGLEIHTAAQCLNAISFVLFVAGFQQLLLHAGARLCELHWGHWLLLSTPYIVGDVLGMLLRDQGFWAAFTWGLVFWLRYTTSITLKHALLFQACIIIAVLFRIEAIAYLMTIPLMALTIPANTYRLKLWYWLQCNALAITILLLTMFAILLGAIHPQDLGRFQDVPRHTQYLLHDIFIVMHAKAELMGKHVLGGYLDDYARFSLWSSLLLIVSYKTLKVAGLPALIALLCSPRAWWSALPQNYRQLSKTTLSTGFIVSTVIILNVFVLSSRYIIASGIVMLTLASFAMSNIQKHWPKWATRTITVVLAALFVTNIWDHSHPDVDRLAVNYIAEINVQHAPVFYDTENARFYAHQPYQNRVDGYVLFKELIAQQKIPDYDYFMISISPDEEDVQYARQAHQVLTQYQYQLVNTLYGWRKKTKAMIYVKLPAKPLVENHTL